MPSIKWFIRHPNKIIIPLLSRYGRRLSDEVYLKLMYYAQMNRKLNLKDPQRFSEKIQWLKLYDRKSEYTQMVDKFTAKQYVAGLIGEKYIIPTLGIWEAPEQIDWDSLPDKFVLKSTNGGGSTGVVLCSSKQEFDRENAIKVLNRSLKEDDLYRICREHQYKDVSHRIIAEKLLEDDSEHGLMDYKVFCCNGKPKMIKVNYDVSTNYYVNWYDCEWNRFNVATEGDHANPAVEIKKPEVLQRILDLSVVLSKGITFLRVDFYCVHNNIFFGELTFHPGSGFEQFMPDSFDYTIGSWIRLPK